MPRSSLILAALFLSGCAHYPVTPRLEAPLPEKTYRFSRVPADGNTDSLFVVLTFSGGGTRAAALAYAVLGELKATEITWKGEKKPLLDEVDLISSVSGGSFAAMYYALFRDRLFADFEPKFLKRNIQRELLHQLFQPWMAARVLSRYYDRIDMAADLYDQTVFEKKTFADLAERPRKPFLIVNATNLFLGDRFEFTQDQFDLLGADLNRVSVARAVAASSAFPLLLSPITFKNYGGDPAIARKKWIVNSLKDYGANRRRYMKAKNMLLYLDRDSHPYVHLMDGGLADNIGLRTVIDSMRDAPEGGIRQYLNEGKIERLVIIVVNAKNLPPDESSRSENAPGLDQVAMKTATISMDNYSFESVEAVKEIAAAREQAEQAVRDCQALLNQHARSRVDLPKPAKSVPVDIVEVSFDAIPDADEKKFFLGLPTSFYLPPDHVDWIVKKGRQLLSQSEEFQQILRELR